MRKSDYIATDSSFSKEELARYVARGKNDPLVIHNGVNQNRFEKNFSPSQRDQIRIKYQLPEKFLLYVGNLKPHKNISGLLQAFKRLKMSEISLVLVGKFEGLRHSIEMISQERVCIIGEILDEEVPIFYSMAELFVFPSYYEGFGLPPLEAMSCGCPTAISDAASMPEICGDAALYFDPHNPEAISKALRVGLQDTTLRNALIEKGFKKIDQFSWSQTAQSYSLLFKQAVTR